MIKYTAIFIFSFISSFCFAQKQSREKIDSLQNELKHSKADTAQIQNRILLAREFITIFPDSGIYYGNLALNKSVAIKNKAFQIVSLLVLGSNYSQKGNPPKALSSFLKALALSEENNDSLNIAKSYTGLGDVYGILGNIPKSSDYLDRALAINKKLKNKSEIASIYLTIGVNYMDLEQYDKALQYYEKALTAALESNNEYVKAYSYSNSAVVFTQMKQFDKALLYQFKALKFEKEMGDKYGIATEFSSISATYLDLSDSMQGKKKDALIDSAVHYLNLAIDLSYQCDIPADRIYMLFSLANIFKIKKDYKKAFELLTHANELKDSVFSDESNNQIQKIETETAILIKEKEIEIHKLQLVKSKQLQIAMIMGIALLLGSVFFIFRSFKKQRSINNKLKETQTQLIQQEKLASLGELTAGIAHEIQNPLNFVNNFSEVSNELIDEMNAELDKGDIEEAKLIAADVKQNLEKISQHGNRASSIVKGMLEHSRNSSGVKELTDINTLADEYLKLAYHGLRAKDKFFNAEMKTDFEGGLPKLAIFPQDFGRVLLNLINNAFYAVNEKQKVENSIPNAGSYKPMVIVNSKKTNGKIEMSVKDNGNGIPAAIKEKIFQPFFTTKPTGKGTGLGLSLAYDIVKAHGGELKVETKEGEGSEFIIQLPIN